MAKKRIYVPVSDSEYEFIVMLANADKRSVAGKAYQILSAGLEAGINVLKDKKNG